MIFTNFSGWEFIDRVATVFYQESLTNEQQQHMQTFVGDLVDGNSVADLVKVQLEAVSLII